ncbi:MAG: ATP-binding cassette domain-containing protein [Vicinamibacterales bacterium]
MTAPLLHYRNVSVYRGERLALDRVSLSIAAGEHVAILGPNGCGKSTLIKTMTRECYPSSRQGPYEFQILGEERWDVTTLRSMLGIVTNDLVDRCVRGITGDFASDFKNAVTGRDTILSGFFSSVGVWSHHQVTPEMARKADAILGRLEIEHVAERRLDELSSGEARRVVIGRALVHEPAALVLDEPTNSLDMRAAHELGESIRTIAQAGTAIVLVTHHLPDIIPEIDRVILMREGTLVNDGRKADILTSAALSDLFGLPLEVTERDGYYSHRWR